jgi:hypothetical protein
MRVRGLRDTPAMLGDTAATTATRRRGRYEGSDLVSGGEAARGSASRRGSGVLGAPEPVQQRAP